MADQGEGQHRVRAAATPVAFGGCFGQLHPACGPVGVLLCSPWGYEELCARKTWRLLAEALADAGYPALRFDYPGCGDSADEGADLEGWVASAVAAARVLRERTGCSQVVLVGQGLGAAVAALAAGRIEEATGLVALAPVVKGRAYLREVAAWAAMIAQANGLAPEPAGGPSIAGMDLPPQVARAMSTLDLSKADLGPTPHALVLGRPGRASDHALVDHLAQTGANVTVDSYAGLDQLLTDPTTATVPREMIGMVTEWVQDTYPQADAAPAPPLILKAPPACVEGRGWRETLFRFGTGEGLVGLFCQPAEPAQDAPAVLLLNGGYDYHVGWARMAVDHARALAEAGVASLRVDAANVGDSPARPGEPEQVLYSDVQVGDVLDAVDWLEDQGFAKVMFAGRCSGAFLALAAAVVDPRVSDLVMVNPLRFVWDPTESVDEAIRFRSFGHYRAKALQPQTLKRVLAGQVDVRGVAGRLAKHGLKSAAASLSGLFGHNPADDLQGQALHRFAVLRDRGARVSLAYSDSELEGVERLARVFGKDGAGLKAFPNMQVSMIEGADHNLTPRSARDWLVAHIKARALGRNLDQRSAEAA